MAEKKQRTKFPVEKKQELIRRIDELHSTGATIKDAAKKVGISDRYYHAFKRQLRESGVSTAPTKNGAVIKTGNNLRSLQEKQTLVNKVDELRKTGMAIKDALTKLSLRPDDYYRYKKQLARENGTLPVPGRDIQMLQFDMGQASKGPLILVMGNPEDVNRALGHMAQILQRS